MLIRCLKLAAVANVVMKEDLPQTSPAWQLARQVVELAGGESPSRPLELLEAQWTDAAAGAEHGGLTRCVPASAYLLAVFRALRCEDGLILERGACWIGMARAWRDGRVPLKQTDEPGAYADLEREFQSLVQSDADVPLISGQALLQWAFPEQGAQTPPQLSPGGTCADIAIAAAAAEARNRDSRPVEKGPEQ
jgi:hypothetical protein